MCLPAGMKAGDGLGDFIDTSEPCVPIRTSLLSEVVI